MWRYLGLLTLLAFARCEYKYETKWFTVPLDHFGFTNNHTFKIKYLECDDYWDMGGGPIFFYTGNEGQIEIFANYTGFMWEIAPEFKAKIVFAEHRYYGASLPFGDRSQDKDRIGYLSSEQALADYADLVNYLQGNSGERRHPVIAFGGSYGGMLSAYFRMKYPHLVAGAIASSAPIHMYPGMVPCDVYNRVVTASYKVANPKCSDNIRQSWSLIRSYAATANGSEWLHKNWNLCGAPNATIDIETLISFLESMFSTVAMINYPFATEFLMPLPANPVNVFCQHLNETLTGENLLQGLGKVLSVYTNHNKECINYASDYGQLNATGWNFQSCTEIVMPFCSTGKSDMFEPKQWNFTQFSEECYKDYNVYPRPDMARIQYGGNMLQAASNIIFSNGLLDPWAAGGILNSVSDSVKALVLIEAAHHLDLMPSNPADPESVKTARNIHKDNISNWIRQYKNPHHRH